MELGRHHPVSFSPNPFHPHSPSLPPSPLPPYVIIFLSRWRDLRPLALGHGAPAQVRHLRLLRSTPHALVGTPPHPGSSAFRPPMPTATLLRSYLPRAWSPLLTFRFGTIRLAPAILSRQIRLKYPTAVRINRHQAAAPCMVHRYCAVLKTNCIIPPAPRNRATIGRNSSVCTDQVVQCLGAIELGGFSDEVLDQTIVGVVLALEPYLLLLPLLRMYRA